ncbi:MAG: hypothetical protein PHN84_04270 [Desulfuromonadaceae bacterium]|nr:hypothetical protein [Desulfuromonadaceae bacterium]MDD2856287.1 hypothetical protein [Desulfuromonadaceae bacterium]
MTFLAATDFNGKKAFNFSVNAMMPDEYKDYAAFFRKFNGHAPKIIIVGLDFFSTNGNFHGYEYSAPAEYFKNAEDPFWRYFTLLSLDSFSYSIRNIRQTIRPNKLNFYDRRLIKTAVVIPESAKQNFVDKDLSMFKRDFYGNTYRYRDLREVYGEFLSDNPYSRFIVFTTPDSLQLWKLLLKEGRLEDYLRWLGDIIEIFGEVYDFMGDNSFTSNSDNYMDGHHFYPQAGKIISNGIMSQSFKSPGILVNKRNYPAHSSRIRSLYSDSKR